MGGTVTDSPFPDWVPGAPVTEQPLIETLKELFAQMDEEAVRSMKRLNVSMKIATQAFEAKNWGLCMVSLMDLAIGADKLAENYVIEKIPLPDGMDHDTELTDEVKATMDALGNEHLAQFRHLIDEADAYITEDERRSWHEGE